jgi:hypothetical protein
MARSPPPPPSDAALNGEPTTPASHKQTLNATPTSGSTLNPFTAPFVLTCASSSRAGEALPDWLHLSLSSSSSDNGDAPLPKRGKGKAPMAELSSLQVKAL